VCIPSLVVATVVRAEGRVVRESGKGAEGGPLGGEHLKVWGLGIVNFDTSFTCQKIRNRHHLFSVDGGDF